VWRNDYRSGYDTNEYVQVADLTTEATAAWTDYEVRRGVAAAYKLRTRRTDGSLSAFTSASSPVTVTASTGPWYTLTSNEIASSYHVSAEAMADDQVFAPPVQRVMREFYGRDGAVAFIPLEDPLDVFDVQVGLYLKDGLSSGFLVSPSVDGRAAFNKIETLARSSLSYVCVRDHDGNRWYANVAVSELRRGGPAGRLGLYTATLHVRELTRTPSTPTS
jgi:hypothetical protein